MHQHFVIFSLLITVINSFLLYQYLVILTVYQVFTKSDCLQILNDIRITLQQWRFSEFLDINGDISTTPFINRGPDVTAGWTMNLNVTIYDNDNWCAIPFDNYDFQN